MLHINKTPGTHLNARGVLGISLRGTSQHEREVRVFLRGLFISARGSGILLLDDNWWVKEAMGITSP